MKTTPKEQADSLLESMTKALFDNGCTITQQGVREAALVAVCGLIAEHTWNSPISWNTERKKYWQAVKDNITNR